MTPIKTTPEITFRQLTKHDATCTRPWTIAYGVPIDCRDASGSVIGRKHVGAWAYWVHLRCNGPCCTATAIVSLAFIGKLPAGEKRKARRGGVR